MTKAKAPRKARVKGGSSAVSAEERRALFAEAYLSNGRNATHAALDAGFSPKSAPSQGARLLKHAKVRQILDSRQQETLGKLQITTERILEETARLAFSDVANIIGKDGKVLLPNELDEATRAAVSSFRIDEYGRIEYKFWDKNTASERLFKHLNLYKENNEGARPLTQVAVVSLVPLEPLQSGDVIDAER